jgi:hypothetical protein
LVVGEGVESLVAGELGSDMSPVGCGLARRRERGRAVEIGRCDARAAAWRDEVGRESVVEVEVESLGSVAGLDVLAEAREENACH